MAQDKQLLLSKEASTRRRLWWLAKAVVTLLILSYLYHTLREEKKGLASLVATFGEVLGGGGWRTLVLMLLLAPVNWAIESLKWQLLARKAVPVTFWEAFRSTLTGLAIGVAVPAQVGDTMGRVASLRSDQRLRAIGAAVVSNGVQFYVSLLAGALSWLALRGTLPLPTSLARLLDGLLAFLLLAGVVVAFFRTQLLRWEPKKPFVAKIASYLRVIGTYRGQELGAALGLGLLRYLIFLGQFLLALYLFDFPLALGQLAACVGLILLAKTLLPALNVLGDLGVREFTALYIFAPFALPAEQVIAATLLVWLVNILGPLVVGVFLIWKYQWRTRYD
ncbi:hypothetical protein GCM10027275_14610 [Rhabdobacter roseus]|uniref:Uncharacterized membrane protein YbhN (UPF0104 family) n=1 Tax=Rhabdobacter roseus TaxID=1655419 RepID=A0A840TJ24_9BACT|nr:lysylphosphatidylglycerol synthase domain-containing protein [Rhabdobacter roseus]MBB5283381.1 uncharacterized membrane protein YbhN (UPF0104 family) [Rhabdobacter roseus]